MQSEDIFKGLDLLVAVTFNVNVSPAVLINMDTYNMYHNCYIIIYYIHMNTQR